MKLSGSLRQLARTPLRTLLFIALLTLVSTFLCLGGGLWFTAQKNLNDSAEKFTTIAVPGLPAIRDIAGVEETTYYYSLAFMARTYNEQEQAQERLRDTLPAIKEAGLASSVVEQDTRRKMMAYAGDISSVRPDNVVPAARIMYHEPYDRVVYEVTCVDMKTYPMTLLTYDDGTEEISSLYLSTKINWQTGRPITAISDPSAENETVYVIKYSMKIERILALQAQVVREPEWIVVTLSNVARSEQEWEDMLKNPLFEQGKRYVVQGRYITDDEIGGDRIDKEGKFTNNTRYGQFQLWTSGMFLMPADYEYGNDSTLHARYVLNEKFTYDSMRAEVTGSIDDFLADPANEYWRDTVDNINITNHSVEVLTTGNINTIYAFHESQQNIVWGRTITKEEHETGAKVCVVSQTFARENGIGVGSTITLQFYPGRYSIRRFKEDATDNITSITQPALYDKSVEMTQGEEYEIVGLFAGKVGRFFSVDWDQGDYAVSANTVIIPDKAVPEVPDIPSPYMDESQYIPPANLFTLTMDNEDAQTFYEEMKELGYGRLYAILDQGYSAVVPGLTVIRNNAALLLGVCLVAWVAIVILFIVMFVLRQRKEAGVMLSLGAGKRKTTRHLVAGAVAVAFLAAVISVGVSLALYETAFDAALNAPTMESKHISLFSEKPVASGTDEEKQALLREAFVPNNAPAIVITAAGVQLLLISVAAWAFARRITRENPMELVRSKEG